MESSTTVQLLKAEKLKLKPPIRSEQQQENESAVVFDDEWRNWTGAQSVRITRKNNGTLMCTEFSHRYPSVTNVELRDCTLNAPIVRFLDKSGLNLLELTGFDCTLALAVNFESLTSLQQLELYNVDVDGAMVGKLPANLKSIELVACTFRGAFTTKNSAVRRLKFEDTRLDEGAYAFLESFTNLTVFTFCDFADVAALLPYSATAAANSSSIFGDIRQLALTITKSKEERRIVIGFKATSRPLFGLYEPVFMTAAVLIDERWAFCLHALNCFKMNDSCNTVELDGAEPKWPGMKRHFRHVGGVRLGHPVFIPPTIRLSALVFSRLDVRNLFDWDQVLAGARLPRLVHVTFNRCLFTDMTLRRAIRAIEDHRRIKDQTFDFCELPFGEPIDIDRYSSR